MIALLAALALLTPAVAPIVGPDGLAWLPDHGHVYLHVDGAHSHSHPWDGAEHQDAAPADAGGVVFTAGGDGGPVGSAAGLAIPAAASMLLGVGLLTRLVRHGRVPLAGRALPPLVPPPQA